MIKKIPPIILSLFLSANAYAAPFTATVTASKIDITAGSGLLDQMYDDVEAVDASAMTKAGQVFTVEGGRELELSSGVTVNMSSGDTLQWDATANDTVVLDVAAGATLTATTNCTLTGDKDDTYRSNVYLYGYTSFQGNFINRVIIEQFNQVRFYNTEGQTPHDWDWVTVRNPTSSSSYCLYFVADNYVKLAHTFYYVTVSSDDHYGYAFYFHPGDWSSITFDYITVDNTRYGISCYGASYKFLNSTFKNIYYYSLIRGNYGRGYYHATTDATDYASTSLSQPKITFDTCTFEANYDSSEYGFYVPYNSVIKFKDCTMQGLSGDYWAYGFRSYYNSKLLYEGTTTFTYMSSAANHRSWSYNGTHYYVYPLALTVQDKNATAIENATVTVRQNEGHEYWHFLTNSSGQIKDLFGDDPVFVEKEETSYASYDQWSDGSDADHKHRITITKKGYQTWTRDVTFNEDQAITATLMPALGPQQLPDAF